MTHEYYKAAARKMQCIINVSAVIVLGPLLFGLMCLMSTFDAAIRAYGEIIRSRFGELIGGAIGGVFVAMALSMPLLLWVTVMLALDHRFGVRCPYCHRSLTARCLPRRVLETGECSLCGTKVLE